MSSAAERKKLRVLAIVHPDLVPPAEGERDDTALWKMEYDVVHTLRGIVPLPLRRRDEVGVDDGQHPELPALRGRTHSATRWRPLLR